MTYLLDTNVVCETTARQPEPRVLDWCETHSADCVLSCVTLGEIWKGIHLMPDGKRRKAIATWADGIEHDFAHQILPLDSDTLKSWGELHARHEANGFNLGILDGLIAATALRHRLIVVTRNTADFPPELRTLNPWLA